MNNDNNRQESENDDDGDALQIAIRKMSSNNLAFFIKCNVKQSVSVNSVIWVLKFTVQ